MRIAALLLLLHALADAAIRVPAQLRLKDGTVYQLQEPPYLKDGRFIFTTSEGKVFSLAEAEVEEIRLLAPPAASKAALNPQDSRQLGAIAHQQRRKTGKSSPVAPAPTPRPGKGAGTAP